MDNYDPRHIEPHWQKVWEENKVFAAKEDPQRPKKYLLSMFPYPSGAGLHVGHVLCYTATDVMARYFRGRGYNVLHPMGWDSFGLPAEQYAIRTGQHPRVTTEKNITTYRKQLKALGLSYDWGREVATSDPSYYKWTQWLVTKLAEKGLAYQAKSWVNYCPALGTVLANEEVEQGRAKEGGHRVERRAIRQWILRITAYADHLLDGLDSLDWPRSIKDLQRNWIGRSEGATVHFRWKEEMLSVFTTCPETLPGVSFLAISDEHPLIEKLVTEQQQEAWKAYKSREKEEVDGFFTGSFVEHPLTGQQIPLWVASYVIAGYGLSAVMGVPAHDERDCAFAEKFSLPITQVYDEKGVMLKDAGELAVVGQHFTEARTAIIAFITGRKIGKKSVSYKLRDWLFSRQRYWGEPMPVVHYEDGTLRWLDLDELPLTPPELEKFTPSDDAISPLANDPTWVVVQDKKTGKMVRRELNTMPQWAGSCWYYLRYLDPHNTEASWESAIEKYWMPVDYYVGGAEHAVLHLLYARFWHRAFFDLGLVSTKEPFQSLKNQGMITARAYKKPGGGYVDPANVQQENGVWIDDRGVVLQCAVEKMSKSKMNGVNPLEIIASTGADALRLYELFMGPFDQEKVWETQAIQGCRRFLQRTWRRVLEAQERPQTLEEKGLVHQLAEAVEADVQQWRFNTAIAKMMTYLNTCSATLSVTCAKVFVQLLAPFAPHIAEELWHRLQQPGLVAEAAWPTWDTNAIAACKKQTMVIAVQVNGRLRGTLECDRTLDKTSIIAQARALPAVAKYLVYGVKKEIYVPFKLINFVVEAQ